MLETIGIALKGQEVFSEEFGKLGIGPVHIVQQLKLLCNSVSQTHTKKVHFSSLQSIAAVVMTKARSSSAVPKIPIDMLECVRSA